MQGCLAAQNYLLSFVLILLFATLKSCCLCQGLFCCAFVTFVYSFCWLYHFVKQKSNWTNLINLQTIICRGLDTVDPQSVVCSVPSSIQDRAWKQSGCTWWLAAFQWNHAETKHSFGQITLILTRSSFNPENTLRNTSPLFFIILWHIFHICWPRYYEVLAVILSWLMGLVVMVFNFVQLPFRDMGMPSLTHKAKPTFEEVHVINEYVAQPLFSKAQII